MRNLKWLTLREIHSSYLKGEALIRDGWPGGYFLEKWKNVLSWEQLKYASSGKTRGDRLEYQIYSEGIHALINKTKVEISDLITAHVESGRLVLAGRTHPYAEEEIIATRYCAFMHLDVENGIARVAGKDINITFHGIRGVFQHLIPAGDRILERIRIVESRLQASTPSAYVADARKIETLASSDPDQKGDEEAGCPSLAKDIETPASTTKRKRAKGSPTLNLHIADLKGIRRGRKEGEPAPTNACLARALSRCFPKNHPGKSLSIKRLANWLGSSEGKSVLSQL